MLAKLERRFARCVSFLASYTYAHSIDGGPSGKDQSDPGPQDATNFQAAADVLQLGGPAAPRD